jgi:hypothetical protein
MTTLNEFVDVSKHQVNAYEIKMARAYLKAVEDLESAKRDHGISSQLTEDAQRRVAETESDIKNFIDIVGSYSRREVAQKRNRSKLDIDNAKRHARNFLKKALQENPDMSPEEVKKLDAVKAAFAKRDAVIAKLKPIIADSERKFNEATEILKKYSK